METECIIKNFYINNISRNKLEKIAQKGYGNIPHDLLHIKKYIKNKSSILEIGSGTGRIGIYLLTMFNIKSYIGLEIINKFTKSFKQKIKFHKDFINSEFKIEEISFLNYSTNKKFDVILFPFSVIMEFTDYPKVLNKINSLLKKGGICIIDNHDNRVDVTTVDSEIFNKFHYTEYLELFNKLGLEVNQSYLKVPKKRGFMREFITLRKK